MYEAPAKAEDFHSLLTNEVLTNTTERFATHMKLYPAVEGDGIRGGAGKAEVVVTVTSGGTDDITMKTYSSKNGASIDTVAKSTATLATAANATLQQTFMIDWATVGSGFALGFTNTGASTTMVVNVVARRVRIQHRV